MITGKDKYRMQFYRQVCAALLYRLGGETIISMDEFELKDHPLHGGIMDRKEGDQMRIKCFMRGER